MLVHLVVVALPATAAFYYAFTDWSGMGEAEFIGFANFQRLLFDDEIYRQAFRNNLVYIAWFTTVPFFLALVAATMLAAIKRGAMVFRAALFIPYILPSVVTAFIWRTLMHPRMGIGAALADVGISGFDQAWLGKPDTALLAIAFADNWHFWGFLLVLFLTAMQNVSPDLYDAASIDGANRWHLFRHVTLPGIRPTLVFMLMMLSIWSFLVFDWIQILTNGGPGHSSEVLSTYLYKQAVDQFEAGYASAIGLSISVFALFIVAIFAFLRKRGWEV